jgi:hypothetical protein
MIKNNSIPIVLLALGFLSAGFVQAQQSANAAGGDATGSGGSAAYSVGQVVNTTHNSPSGTVSQGVQQAYEIYSVGIKETELNISLSVFPNPIVENLILQISDYNHEKLSFHLYDIQGKLVNKGQIITKQTQLNTSSLPPATYFIEVLNQENKHIQSFKIIKN